MELEEETSSVPWKLPLWERRRSAWAYAAKTALQEVVFLVSSTLRAFHILPPRTSPRTHFIFLPESWIEISLKERGGGRAKSFQHINEQQAALSRRSSFLCQIYTRLFQPHCIIWPKTFSATPILLFHVQQNTQKLKKEEEEKKNICKKEFERRWDIMGY